jgi:NAD(P)-dependent dehydrogenase (short-subunit alcohol dehydrogenase family)
MALPERVLVTGAALRTGRAIVRHLAEKGSQIIVHANMHIAEAEELCGRLPGCGHIAVSGDLSVPSDVDEICRYAAECDGIVLNASLYRHNYNGGDAEFDKKLDAVNYLAQMRIIESFVQAVHPDGGAVVAMLDQAISSDDDNPYLASRRMLWQSMKEFAIRYGEKDLRFNAVLPGPMLPPPELGDTGMVRTLPTLPLKRSVSLDDVADCVEFLLSCRSLTGTVLFADCGQSAVNRKNKL